MTKEQRTKIEKLLKPNQMAVDTRAIEKGVDTLGFPLFEIQYINPPKNFKVITILEPYNGAILEDLDYESKN